MTSERAAGWVDEIAHRLIHRAARRAPVALSERLTEEWLADLEAQGGAFSRLRFAFGCCWATTVISREHAVAAVPATGSAVAHAPLIRHARDDFPFFTGRTLTFVLVASLHVAVLYALAMQLGPAVTKIIAGPFAARVIEPPPRSSIPASPRPQLSILKFEPPPPDVMPPIAPEPPDTVADTRPVPADVAPPPPSRPAEVDRILGGPGLGFPSTDDFYPDASLRMGERGVATVSVCVDGKGRLTSGPTIVQSTGSTRLDQGALRLAKAGSGHYRATTEDGRPVSSCYPFRIRFELRN